MFWKKKKKEKEIKSLGRAVSWEEWNKSELPVAVHSHMISVFANNNLKTIIGPGLVDFDIFIKKNEVLLSLHTNIYKDTFNKDQIDETFMFCMSDDPSMEHAGDWTQMGCMRIFFVMYEPKYEVYSDRLVIKCDRDKFVLQDSYNEVSVDKVIA